jgi:hypothetical protein
MAKGEYSNKQCSLLLSRVALLELCPVSYETIWYQCTKKRNKIKIRQGIQKGIVIKKIKFITNTNTVENVAKLVRLMKTYLIRL